MAVVILGITMAVLDGTIVNLALPGIARDVHADAALSIWVINAYQVATLSFLLPAATLGDFIGYRRVYLAGVTLFTLASLACAFSQSLAGLTAARAVQGLGAAGIMSVNAALLRLIYPKSLLGKGVAINSLVVALASVAGPTAAAAILSHASWPWLFAINAPLGAAILLFGRHALPDNATETLPLNRFAWGDVVLNAALFSTLFLGADALGGATPQGSHLFPSSAGLSLLLAAVPIGFVYVRRQLGRTLPILPVDLLRIPVFALSMCTSITAFAAQMLAYIVLPFLFLDAYGHTPYQAGVLITAWPLAIVVIAPLVGKLIGRIPDGLLGSLGLALLSAGLALLAALPGSPRDADIVWRLVVCGLGFGLFQSPNNHTIVTSAPAHRSGGASGMLRTARLTGQTLGAVLVTLIFSVANPHDGQGPTVALATAAVFSAFAAVFSGLRLKSTGPTT